MKPLLPVLLGSLVLNLAALCPAQDPAQLKRPPGSAQRTADSEPRNPALGDVLAELGRLLGKKILMDATVSATTALSVSDLGEVDPQRKASLLERAIFLNGYALIDADKETVIILGPGKNPRAEGLPLYTKPEELPVGERVFSYLFKLEHADAIETAGFLQQFIPPGNDVNFTALEKSHQLIATARTSVMRTVIRLVAANDVEGTEKSEKRF